MNLTANVLWSAIRPMIKVLIYLSSGALFGHAFQLSNTDAKLIATMDVQMLYPCLLFSKTLISAENMHADNFGLIMLSASFYIGFGMMLGWLIRRLTKPPKDFYYAATAFGNTADITIAVIYSLGEMAPFKENDTSLGVAYTSLYNLLPSVLMYTVVYSWIRADFEPESEKVAIDTSAGDIALGVPRHTFFAAVYKKFVNRVVPFVRALITPMNLSIFIALFIGSIPALAHLFIAPIPSDAVVQPPLSVRTRQAPLGFFYECMDFLGAASVPLGIMTVGAAFQRLVKRIWSERRAHLNDEKTKTKKHALEAQSSCASDLNLMDHPSTLHSGMAMDDLEQQERESLQSLDGLTCISASSASQGQQQKTEKAFTKSTMIIASCITVARLLILPACGIFFFEFILTRWARIVPKDATMLRFVLLFQGAVPTAQLVLVLSQIFDPTGACWTISSVGLLGYGCSIVTVSAWLVVILGLLGSTT